MLYRIVEAYLILGPLAGILMLALLASQVLIDRAPKPQP